jgi:hypothetical protein
MTKTPKILLLAAVLLLVAAPLFARKEKEKDSSPSLVDSGAFGVFVKGNRVATETFRIEQRGDVSVSTSEFRTDEGPQKSVQRSEMRVASNGDLRSYEWREVSPGKAQSTVEQSEQFLIEKSVPNPPDKPQQKPFMVPVSTVILDDYFFVHREILAWRYLAQGCGGQSNCKLTKQQFGVIVPRQQISSMVSIEYVGKETLTLHGAAAQLDRFTLTADGVDWSLWLDGNMKLVRILIPSENTEVVRE